MGVPPMSSQLKKEHGRDAPATSDDGVILAVKKR